jgi:hypothetical protein
MTSAPALRDRYVDLLRVVSLATVILGHWLMAAPVTAADGSVHVTNVLALVPALQPLTWLLQIMPVFFLVGGFAHATALTSPARRGGTYADFARSRAGRLLRPTAAFIAVWTALAVAAGLAGVDQGLVRVALRTVAQPLWFLGVYLGLVAVAPVMYRLHRRLGWAVPVVLLALTGGVDLLRFGGHAQIAYANLVFVWLGVHQLGFFYADGRLGRWRWPFAIGGLAALVALTVTGPYPISMVGVPGDKVSNMSPPTLALAAQAVFLTGLVMLARGPVTRWLDRARVWRAVVVANGMAMTAFLWHLSAAIVVLGVALSRGWDEGPVGTLGWWLTRPLGLGAAAVLTWGLITVFRRFDAPRVVEPVRGAGWVAAVGMAACTVGMFGLSTVGFGGLVAGRVAMMIGLPVTAPLTVALIAAGAGLIRFSHPAGRRFHPVGPVGSGGEQSRGGPGGRLLGRPRDRAVRG